MIKLFVGKKNNNNKNKNKEISAFWAVFPVKYLRNGRRYSSSVSTMAKAIVALPNGANDVSVVHIVSEI